MAVQCRNYWRRSKKSKDPVEKRKIRANLRRLGHKGGLNLPRKKKAKKAKKA